MVRLILPLLLFGSMIYWIFGAELLSRHRRSSESAGWIAWLILAVELLLAGVLLARVPVLRTPPALLVGAAAVFSLHYALTARIARSVRRKGWIDVTATPAGAEERNEEEAGRLTRIFARNQYILVITAYLVVIGLVLAVARLRSG